MRKSISNSVRAGLLALALTFSCTTTIEPPPQPPPPDYSSSAESSSSLSVGTVLCLFEGNCVPIVFETCFLIGQVVQSCPAASSSSGGGVSPFPTSSSSSIWQPLSSSSLPSGNVLCLFEGNCVPLASETCSLIGQAVQSCPVSSSSSIVLPSSNSVVPSSSSSTIYVPPVTPSSSSVAPIVPSSSSAALVVPSSSSIAPPSSSSFTPSSSSIVVQSSSSKAASSSSAVSSGGTCASDETRGNMCLWDSGCWPIQNQADRTECARHAYIFRGGIEGSTLCSGGTFICGRDNSPPSHSSSSSVSVSSSSFVTSLGCCRWDTETKCWDVYTTNEKSDCNSGENKFWNQVCPNKNGGCPAN